MSKQVLNIRSLGAEGAKVVRHNAAQRSTQEHRSSPALEEFQRSVHRYFTCFAFATKGFEMVRLSMPAAESAEQRLFIGNGPPESGSALARIGLAEAHDFLLRDGLFTDAIAKSLLVRIYSEWEEKFRSELAAELGLLAASVTCDLMGDVRLIRNWIVHDKSVVQRDVSRIKVVNWPMKPGDELIITMGRFEELMIEVNRMVVAIAFR